MERGEKATLSFDDWCADKDALMDEKREAAAAKAQAIASRAEEGHKRGQTAFKLWLENKDLVDKSIALLNRLDAKRFSTAEGWKEIGHCLASIGEYLEERQYCLSAEERRNVTSSDTKTATMKQVFVQWSRKHYSFDEAVVPSTMLSNFTRGAISIMDSNADGAKVIGGLQYTTITPPSKRGEVAKPLTPDEKLRNQLFDSLVIACWKACKANVLRDANEATKSAAPTATTALSQQDITARKAFFVSRGIRHLAQMVEKDERRRSDAALAETMSKRDEGKRSHETWKRQKDAMRIKLPSASVGALKEATHPRMDFSSGKGSGRAPVIRPKLSNTTVDIMMRSNMGLQYAHATGRSATAMKDLEESRARLLEAGYVYKANFVDPDVGALDEEAEEKYEDEKLRNEARRARLHADRDKFERDTQAFENWSSIKQSAEFARDCLALLPITISDQSSGATTPASGTRPRPSTATSGRQIIEHRAATNDDGTIRMPTPDEEKLWEAVGYACRQIDRTLLSDWVAWSKPLFAPDECNKYWLHIGRSESNSGRSSSHRRSSRSRSRSRSRGRSTRSGMEERKTQSSPSRSRSPSARTTTAAATTTTHNLSEAEARKAAVKLLQKLTAEHRQVFQTQKMAAAELTPAAPTLRRVAEAEVLPAFVHGHEGAVALLQEELGVQHGHSIPLLNNSGVGAEVVLQWWVGDLGLPASDARMQPPYALVLETCGISGGKDQREGNWRRVVVDPPQPVDILTSAPASSAVSLSVSGQGLGPEVIPPQMPPNVDGFAECLSDPTRLRGCIRITGLLPNTTYCYRLRAYNRVGVSPYAFGVFTTAAAPPPPPVLATPALVPTGLLNVTDAAEAAKSTSTPACTPQSLRMCWDHRIGRRAALLRLVRVYLEAVRLTQEVESGTPHNAAGQSQQHRPNLFLPDDRAAERTVLLRCVQKEHGVLQFLLTAVASPAFWVNHDIDSAKPEDDDEPIAIQSKRPCSVYDALVADARSYFTLADVLEVVGADDMALADPDKSLHNDVALLTMSDKESNMKSGASTDGARYSLLQCVSDGEEGQQWKEVFVGMKTLKSVMKLLPSTAYCFRAQIMNADGVVSHIGAPSILSTALPAPHDITIKSRNPTSVSLQWSPVSGVNQLAIARGLAHTDDADDAATDADGRPKTSRSSVSQLAAPSTVDALLGALTQKAKTSSARPGGDSKTAEEIGEGDGGVGVDLMRYWSHYDTEGAGFIDHMSFRGLLGDLGAISESGYVDNLRAEVKSNINPHFAAEESNDLSENRLANLRFAAALAVLDPQYAGRIKFADFSQWWNGIDSTKLASKAKVGAASRGRSASSARNSNTAGRSASRSPGAFRDTGAGKTHVYTASGLHIDGEGARSSTVLYLVERKAKLPPAYASAASNDDWQVVALAATSKLELNDLVPNTEYTVRVSCVGRHSESPQSKIITFMTLPLAPFAPVIIRTAPRYVVLRWYPAEMTCAKFELKYRPLESLLQVAATQPDAQTGHIALEAARAAIYKGRNTQESRARQLITQAPSIVGEVEAPPMWVQDINDAAWRTGYCGTSAVTLVSGLTANTILRFRVYGLTKAGGVSHPSIETQVVTPDSSTAESFTPANASKTFVVELPSVDVGAHFGLGGELQTPSCVAGDVICFTEDVYVDSATVRKHSSDTLHFIEVPYTHPRARIFCSRTVAAAVIGDSASRMAAANCEGMPGTSAMRDAVHSRSITLQVEWCTIGGYPSDARLAEAEASCKIPHGSIIKRAGDALSKLDVFRCPWEDEAGRWTLLEELAASYDVPVPPSATG